MQEVPSGAGEENPQSQEVIMPAWALFNPAPGPRDERFP